MQQVPKALLMAQLPFKCRLDSAVRYVCNVHRSKKSVQTAYIRSVQNKDNALEPHVL